MKEAHTNAREDRSPSLSSVCVRGENVSERTGVKSEKQGFEAIFLFLLVRAKLPKGSCAASQPAKRACPSRHTCKCLPYVRALLKARRDVQRAVRVWPGGTRRHGDLRACARAPSVSARGPQDSARNVPARRYLCEWREKNRPFGAYNVGMPCSSNGSVDRRSQLPRNCSNYFRMV